MEKMMEKLVTRYMKDETMGHVPYIHNNLPTERSTQTTMQHVVTGVQSGAENVEVTLDFPRY
jgi:hypothetical protein